MRNMCRLGWGVVGLVCLAACVHTPETGGAMLAETRHPRQAFTDIQVYGPFDVHLKTATRTSTVRVRAHAKAFPALVTQVKNNVLSIQCPHQCAKYGRLHVTIETPHLRAFGYEGSGRVMAERLHAPVLNVSIRNTGLSTFSGYLGLHHVLVGGGGTAIFKGVYSNHLSVVVQKNSKAVLLGRMKLSGLKLEDHSDLTLDRVSEKRLVIREHGTSILRVRGHVHTLDAELLGQSQLKARRLMAEHTFVKAYDQARVEISTANHQHVLASGDSHIHFYHLPKTKADFMAYNGAVLNMEPLIPARFGYDPHAPDN